MDSQRSFMTSTIANAFPIVEGVKYVWSENLKDGFEFKVKIDLSEKQDVTNELLLKLIEIFGDRCYATTKI